MARILVIDDDEAIRRLILRSLAGGKHELVEAENGAAGLARMKKFSPDIVITDMLMPEKEGIETIREIRGIAPHTKIIAISGGGMSRNLKLLDLARALGADAALAKPFHADDLRKIVAGLLPSDPAAGAA